MSALEPLSVLAPPFALKGQPGSPPATQVAFVLAPAVPFVVGGTIVHWLRSLNNSRNPLAQPLAQAVRNARNANDQLVGLMRSYTPNNASSDQLKSMRNQTEAALSRLRAARDQLKAKLSSPQARNLPAELNTPLQQTLSQVNHWVVIGETFLRKLLPMQRGVRKHDPNDHFSRSHVPDQSTQRTVDPQPPNYGTRASAKNASQGGSAEAREKEGAPETKESDGKKSKTAQEAQARALAEQWFEGYIQQLKEDNPGAEQAIEQELGGGRGQMFIEAITEAVQEQLKENPGLKADELFACWRCQGNCGSCITHKMRKVN